MGMIQHVIHLSRSIFNQWLAPVTAESLHP